jgi:hypothetical protein
MRAARNAGHNRAFGTMLSLVAFGISCCTPAFGLSPTRASQLVTLEAESQSTGCAGNGQTLFFAIRKQQNGLPAAFFIRPGLVLVITSAEVEVTGSVGSGAEVRLLIGDRRQGGEVSRETVVIDANGRGTANFQLSNGIAIAAGQSLCVTVVNGTATFFGGTAHGFLVANQ